MALSAEQKFRVAVGGLGAIGGEVASRLDQGIPGLSLATVAARDVEKARRRIATFRKTVPVVSLGELAGVAFLTTFNSGYIVLTGTASIIILAYFVRRLAYMFRAVSAAMTEQP